MIDKSRVVFVLGAGASVPYGFPTGQGLREMLCRQLLSTSSQLHRIMREQGHAETDIFHFAKQFEGSGLASIDSFIARRETFRQIAEHAIAAALLPCERSSDLNNRRVSDVEVIRGRGDWYQYLWGLMVDGVDDIAYLRSSTVKFITFNYDRSLEQFLHTACCNVFGVDDPVAHSFVASLNIHHMYGSLGDYEHGAEYRYGETNSETISRAATSIKTVPLTRPDVDERAMNMLARADLVMFLGFGFDAMNCNRLGLKQVIERRHDPNSGKVIRSMEMHFTAFGLTDGEISRVFRNALPGGIGNLQFNPFKGDCLSLMRAVGVGLAN
jgi:hypothetical protein